MPDFIEPQLALLVEQAPASPWVHEIKFDGYRMQCRIAGGKCVLRSRSGLDWTHRFPEIAEVCKKLPDCIIDGEICALDRNGHPSFSGLQHALSKQRTEALVFFVFDLLWLEREDYRPYALETRKKVLANLLRKIKSPTVRYVEHHAVAGETLFKSACEMKLEGIVSKNPDARYVSGRVGHWKKTKCRPRQEAVICGWEMNGAQFARVILGVYQGQELTYIGGAGTGFNSHNLPELTKKLKALETLRMPFTGKKPKRASGQHWCQPQLVCEIAFETWTRSGVVRQASFKGLRLDKKPREVAAEIPIHEEEA